MKTSIKPAIGWAPLATRRCRNVKVTAIAEVLKEGTSAGKPEVPAGLNKFSARITQPKSQGASQAMLYGTGLKEDDMSKPQVNRMPLDWTLYICYMTH